MRSSSSKGIRDYEFPLVEFQREPSQANRIHEATCICSTHPCVWSISHELIWNFSFVRSLELLFPLWLSFRENVVNNFLPAPRHPANGTCRASCRLIERLEEHLIIESCFQHHHHHHHCEYQICLNMVMWWSRVERETTRLEASSESGEETALCKQKVIHVKKIRQRSVVLRKDEEASEVYF